DVFDTLTCKVREPGDLFHRRLAFVLRDEGGPQLDDAAAIIGDVDGQTNGAIQERTLQRLLDPPRGVGAEAETPQMVELVCGAEETEVALLNQIEKRHPPAEVLSREEHDQAKIARHEPSFGSLDVRLCFFDLGPGLAIA